MDGTRENKHGGLLICASAVSQGATFTIKLPIGRGSVIQIVVPMARSDASGTMPTEGRAVLNRWVWPASESG